MTLTINRKADLNALLGNEGTHLTICLPIDREHSEKNRIHLKNAISLARELMEGELDSSISNSILKTLESVEQHDAFRSPTYPGLALLLHIDEPERLSLFPLWRTPKAEARLGATPYLVPFLRNQPLQEVLVVHLADNGPTLLRGHYGHLEECPLPGDCPSNLDEVTAYEQKAGLDGNESFRDRSKAPGAGTIHGEGPVEKVEHEFSARYFRAVGESLCRHLKNGERLLLSGVEQSVSLFRSLHEDLPILEVELYGNFDRNLDALKEKAQRLLEQLERGRLKERLETAQSLPPEAFGVDQQAIHEAALQNRIATLFLNELHPEIDGFEPLALEVLNGGGKVYMVEHPSWKEALLATYRW